MKMQSARIALSTVAMPRKHSRNQVAAAVGELRIRSIMLGKTAPEACSS